MELDISEFFRTADPATYSASIAEIGNNAGAITWHAATEADFLILDDEEKRQAFRDFIRSAGAWDDSEIAAFSPNELNALCIQWISGDMREAGLTGTESDDWEEYTQGVESGRYSGRIFGAENGRVFFYIGN